MNKPMSNNKIKPQIWMTEPDTVKVMAALTINGGEARFVGGCVRDAVLGKESKDIDIATTHEPEKVMELLEYDGIKAIPTGIEHGTITAVVNHKPFEITTLRRDVETYGRHAKVEYTDSWQEDAARRDFTMNAMSMDDDGNIYDYFNGINDISKGVVKFVGDPEQRIQEDYLRILRLFRFHAYYGKQEIDEKTLGLCKKYAEKIKTLSGERIQQEMLKLLSTTDPVYVLQVMQDNEVLEPILNGIKGVQAYETYDNLIMLENKIPDYQPNYHARLGLIFASLLSTYKEPKGIYEEVIRRFAGRWKLSNKIRNDFLSLIYTYLFIDENISEQTAKKITRNKGKECFFNSLLIYSAINGLDSGYFMKTYAIVENWQIPKFPLSGKDLITLGIKEGKDVGDILRKAEIYWEASDYKPDKNELVEYVRRVMEE